MDDKTCQADREAAVCAPPTPSPQCRTFSAAVTPGILEGCPEAKRCFKKKKKRPKKVCYRFCVPYRSPVPRGDVWLNYFQQCSWSWLHLQKQLWKLHAKWHKNGGFTGTLLSIWSIKITISSIYEPLWPCPASPLFDSTDDIKDLSKRTKTIW